MRVQEVEDGLKFLLCEIFCIFTIVRKSIRNRLKKCIFCYNCYERVFITGNVKQKSCFFSSIEENAHINGQNIVMNQNNVYFHSIIFHRLLSYSCNYLLTLDSLDVYAVYVN